MIDLTWYYHRLRKMSAREIIYRSRDAALKLGWRVRYYRSLSSARPLRPLAPEPFALPDIDALALGVSAQARRAVLEEASQIMRGDVVVLNHRSWLLGEHPDWFTDLRTGRRAPNQTYCFDIPYRDADAVGEIKYVWEPSRHHHLTILAAAYYLSGDEAYAERVAGHLQSWWDVNPFLRGVHWTSAIEIGIRLISWVWLRRLLDSWQPAPAVFENNPCFLQQLYDHQRYLAALRSHGSSANNHLFAELTGLFASASAFPLFEQSERWRRWAGGLIEREVVAQTYPDGLNRELATAYHGLFMELLLAAAVEDDWSDPAFGEMVWERLASMADAIASMVDASGRPPAQGDDDGGVALLVDGRPFDRWRSLLATCRRVVGHCDWWPDDQGGDLRAALLATKAGKHIRLKRPSRPIRHFAGGGMVLLRDLCRDANEIWCRADHGPLGFLSTAAHGHADALSIELRHGGVDVLCDPGTYCYHGHDDWRAYFRSTVAHNTLELDGADQCRASGLFLWLDQPGSTLEHVRGLDEGDVAEWIAVHDGYLRLAAPALHRRRVRLDRRARTLDVYDDIISRADHQARLAFHLAPHVQCRLEGTNARLSWAVAGRVCHAVLSLPSALKWSLHRGEYAPIMGWYSPAFGLVQATHLILGIGTVGSHPLHSCIAFEEVPHPQRRGGE